MQRLVTAVAIIFTASALAWADDTNTFTWQGNLAAGQVLTILNVSGTVSAGLSPNNTTQVTAVKSGVKDDPSLVQVREIDTTSGASICVIYPNGNDTCPGDSNSGSGSNDVQVQFTISLPSGVALAVNNVSGNLTLNGMTAGVSATTVSGQITLSTTGGSAHATTVSGSIVATIGSMDWSGQWSTGSQFTAVTGSVDVTIPATANVRVYASTVNGTITSDFQLPITSAGNVSCTPPGTGQTMEGDIGAGGRLLQMTTVTGSVHLRASS